MGRSSIPPALIELCNPTSPEAQVTALRNLKNEIVGHDQRKELAVRHGVVKPLAEILRVETRKGGKRRRGGALNGNSSVAREAERAIEWNTEDELRFQATLVVGSLANGESRQSQIPKLSTEWQARAKLNPFGLVAHFEVIRNPWMVQD